jgi:hypothetical protein
MFPAISAVYRKYLHKLTLEKCDKKGAIPRLGNYNKAPYGAAGQSSSCWASQRELLTSLGCKGRSVRNGLLLATPGVALKEARQL